MHIHNLVTSCVCIAPLSDDRESDSDRPCLRGKQCTASVSSLCFEMFGIEGWVKVSTSEESVWKWSFFKPNALTFLGIEFLCFNAPLHCFVWLGSDVSQELRTTSNARSSTRKDWKTAILLGWFVFVCPANGKSVGAECCWEVFGAQKNGGQKSCRKVLDKRVVGKCWRRGEE